MDESRDEAIPQLMVLATQKVPEGIFTYFVDEERMLAYLSATGLHPNLTEDRLRELIEDAEIEFGIPQESIDEVLAAAADGVEIDKLLIAEGAPPVAGTDAHLDFHKRPLGMRRTFGEDETKVDYREASLFENVEKGDRVATFVPLVDGKGGTDVHGRVLPAPPVKDLVVEPGELIHYKESAREYYAEANGLVMFVGNRISVSSVLQVRGDVDLAQGNIRFIGSVEIEGDVRDDFVVHAGEGIHVRGTAEACELNSAKDIVIEGGVTGKGKGRLEAKGSITARFLNEAHVVCEGDVIVNKEVINCRIECLGRMILRGGSFVGGEVVALRGILVGDAGSELGVKTSLIAGLDYHVGAQLLDINRGLNSGRNKEQEMLETLGPLLERALKIPVVDNALREQIEDSMRDLRRVHREVKRLEKESGELSIAFADRSVDCVTVTGKIHPSVVVVCGQYELESMKCLSGPLSFFPDKERSSLGRRPRAVVEKLWEGMAPEEAIPPEEEIPDEQDGEEAGS